MTGEAVREHGHQADILAHATMIPNLIDDMGLSVYAVRLYVRLKRRVRQLKDGGTIGEAYESTRSMARTCGMSPSTVSKAKKELQEAGLIRIEKMERGHGEFPGHRITIVNIWEANRVFYSETLKLEAPDGSQQIWGREARTTISRRPDLKKQLPGFIQRIQAELIDGPKP